MTRFFSAALVAVMLLACAGAAHAESVRIRFGILPVIDTLPLQVAQKEGFFAEQGLDVELVPFTSALERDTAMQAGRIDGYFGDLIATCMLVQSGVDMHIALVSWHTKPGWPMFGVVTSPGRKGSTAQELAGARAGLSRSTVMEFLLDRIEKQSGVGQGHFKRVEVKKIPIRLQMLLSNQLDLAILPEPLLSLAEFKGGSIVHTDENLDIPVTVLCLASRYFEDGGRDYRSFLTAYTKAVKAIAANPEKYRGLMADTCRIPPPLVPDFPMYPYPEPYLPSEEDLDDVQGWMVERGLLRQPLKHEQLVSPVQP